MTYGTDAAGTFEEWRVTGEPGHGYPTYDFVWSPIINPQLGDPREAALTFIEKIRLRDDWADGPRLSHRTVTITNWHDEERP